MKEVASIIFHERGKDYLCVIHDHEQGEVTLEDCSPLSDRFTWDAHKVDGNGCVTRISYFSRGDERKNRTAALCCHYILTGYKFGLKLRPPT